MPRPLLTTLGVLAALTILTDPGAAQESTTRGFTVGAHLGGASLSIEDAETSNGGGGGLFFGYGFDRRFTVFLQLDGSSVDVQNQPDLEGDWTVGHADLGARFHFANSLRSWVPYLQGAFTARAVRVTNLPTGSSADEVEFSGGAFTLGGGVSIYPSQTLAFDISVLWSGGEFTDITIGQTTQSGFDIDAQSTRLNLGMMWWP